MKLFKTIRSRFILIYFVLVSLAIVLIGIFILRSFEDSNLREVINKIDLVHNLFSNEIDKLRDPFSENRMELQQIISRQLDMGLKEEIFLISSSNLEIIASTLPVSDVGIERLDGYLITKGLESNVAGKNLILSRNLRVSDRVYPYKRNGTLVGLIYIRHDLTDLYKIIDSFRGTIIQAIFIALVGSLIISTILSRSITSPINELTQKAKLLAQGDLDQKIEVKSDDEIGAFSSTFKYLVQQIKSQISVISTEKAKLETILNNLNEGIVAISNDGMLIQSNSIALDLMGGIDVAEIKTFYEKSKERNESPIIFRNDRVLKLYFEPFLDKSTNKNGYIMVIQDITKAEKLENMRKDFVANVSHELKTPLTSIISYGETIIDDVVSDQESIKKFLKVMVSEAERMSRLVSDLLILSNFDYNKNVLHREWTNVYELIDKCVTAVYLSASQDNKTIDYIGDNSFSAYIDIDRMEQVFLNIIHNAIKYSENGSKIKIELRFDDNSFTTIISDNGRGIAQADLERIFERFYRVDKARSRSLGGTGLGLSIAKGIVDAHGGTIHASSELGLGTTMTITIPIS